MMQHEEVFEKLLKMGHKKLKMWSENGEIVLRYNYHMEGVGFGFNDIHWDTIRGKTVAEVLEQVK